MDNADFENNTSCGFCKNRSSEECVASFIKVIRIVELETKLEVTSKRSM
jgi:hypothetical protein